MPTVRYTVMDGEIVSENRNGTIRDYVPDPLGSTIALLDQNQNITDTFSYWPYGEERTRTGTTPTPFRFRGGAAWYYGVATLYSLNPVYSPRYAVFLNRSSPRDQGPSSAHSGPGKAKDPWVKRKPWRRPWEGISYPGSTLHEVSGLPTLAFQYGQYCGSQNRKNPGWNLVHQDSIDYCCRIHDQCLEAHYGADFSGWCAHKCCDCFLYGCVENAERDYKCYEEYPHPRDDDKLRACLEAQAYIKKGLHALCSGIGIGAQLGRLVTDYECPSCLPDEDWWRYQRLHWGNPNTGCPKGIGSGDEK